MSWSKVTKQHKKPLKWWYHKLMCEIGWIKRHKMYYYHLDKCISLGFNLYGDKI